MKRRVAIVALLCAAVLVPALLLAGGAKEGKAAEKVTVRVLGLTDPGISAESKLAQEFSKESGIEVVYETYEWGGFVEKVKLEFANPSGSYDILEYDANMAMGMLPNENLVPMEPFTKEAALGDIGFKGFVGRLVDYYGTWKGKVVGIPRSSANRMYGYRKDLFEDPQEQTAFRVKYGYDLKFPDTWKQFRDVAEFFTRDTNGDGTIDFWGVGNGFSADGDAYDAFADIYRSYDIARSDMVFLDKDMKPNFNGKEGVEALTLLMSLVKGGFVSPGYYNRLWVEEPIELGAGRVAMAATYSELYSALMAPEYKDVVGKIGYAELPKAQRRWTLISSMNYGISKGSKHPKEAYRYLAWLFSDRNDARLVTEVETAKMPAREKTFTDPKVNQVLPFAAVQARTHGYAEPWPRFVEFEELMVGLSIAVQEAIDGKKTPQQALDDAANSLSEKLEQAGYYRK